MSHDTVPLTQVSKNAENSGPDLSRFLADHYVALNVLEGPHRGAEYPIRRERTVLGRSRKVDLVFDEESLSREHAAIHYDRGRFVLEDQNSANGCLHNGRPAHSVELAHGDTIQLGRVRMKFILEARKSDSGTHLVETD